MGQTLLSRKWPILLREHNTTRQAESDVVEKPPLKSAAMWIGEKGWLIGTDCAQRNGRSVSLFASRPGHGPLDAPNAQVKEPSREKRVAVLDGIRGIAILLVLCNHFILGSGLDRTIFIDRVTVYVGRSLWIGVDLFFVLSGFLITGILFDTKQEPQYFRTFYGRRILRIFPLYYGVLAVVFLAAPLVLGRVPLGLSGDAQFWYWTYLSNFDVALNGWPWPSHLGHFWSLAVEEQFYLIWPLVVLSLGRRRLMAVTASCFLLAPLFRLVGRETLGASAAFTLMPMRMDALAAGALLALVVRGEKGWAGLGRWPWLILAASGTPLAVMFVHFRGFPPEHGTIQIVGYSFIALSSAALIAVAMTASSGSLLRRLLESRPLTLLGVYSYGLYVIHNIVQAWLVDHGLQASDFPTIMGSRLPGLLVFSAVAMFVSSLLALASWHFWEMPFLRLKRHFRYRRPAGVSANLDARMGAGSTWFPPRKSVQPD